MTTDFIICAILIFISVILLISMCKENSFDYKKRIRVYCAIYHDEIYYANTIRSKTVKYIKELGDSIEQPEIKIKYMTKLEYSLTKTL